MKVDDRFSRSLAKVRAADDAREQSRYSFGEYLSLLSATYSVGGNSYTVPVNFTQPGKKQEPITNEFVSMAGAFRSNGVVFSVVNARARLFTEATFKYKNLTTGQLFGNPGLRLLEEPWPNGTTGDMLTLAELAVSLGGNCYFKIESDRLRWLRPDWVSIILSSRVAPDDPGFAWDAEIVGYVYHPIGTNAAYVPEEIIPVAEMVHWTPIPDPLAPWRGMSWLSPIVREVMADSGATDHKLSFFEHGATPNGVIKMPESVTTRQQFEEIKDMFETSHAGAQNAWKTLYLAAGTEWQQVGMDMTKMDFRAIQAAGEVRIANAGGVPPSVIGLNESLQGAALNAGNFTASRRLFADGWARPQWRSMSAAFAKCVPAPTGAKLWYDESDIAFLREDQLAEAQVQQNQATTVMTLVNAGWEPDAAVEFVQANDLSKLSGAHTGLLSVQLQPAGQQDQQDTAEPQDGPEESKSQEVLDVSLALQKVYLAVGQGILSEDEARVLVNRIGAGLEGPAPVKPERPPPEPRPMPGAPPDAEDQAEPPEPAAA